MPTATFTDANISAINGWQGIFDLTSYSNNRVIFDDSSCLITYVTGTSCVLNTFGTDGQLAFWVYVDGLPAVNPPIAGGQIVVFSGLSDGPHLIRIVGQKGYDPFANTPLSGPVLTVTGAAPAISAGSDLGVGYTFYDPSYPGGANFLTQTSGAYTGFTNLAPLPAVIASRANSNGSGSAAIRATATDLWIYTGDPYCTYAVDDGPLITVQLDNPTDFRKRPRKVTTGLDGTTPHRYTLLPGYAPSEIPNTTGNAIGLMIGGPSATYGIYKPSLLIQLGDSVTTAVDATISSDCDCYRYSHAFGMLGLALGVSGATTAQLASDIPLWLGAIRETPSFAVLAIGLEDSATDSSFPALYTTCVNLLLGAKIPSVIARGVTPNLFTQNPVISSTVAAINNPNVVYVETSGWSGIETGGAGDGQPTNQTGVHPDTNGYATMAAYETQAYAPYLGNLGDNPTSGLTLQLGATTGTTGQVINFLIGLVGGATLVKPMAWSLSGIPGGTQTGTIASGTILTTGSFTVGSVGVYAPLLTIISGGNSGMTTPTATTFTATGSTSGGLSGTNYSVVGIPANPVVGASYQVTAVLNDPASTAGTITPTPQTGLAWGLPLSIPSGGISDSTTLKFTASGSYTPVFKHAGLGFAGDPTLSAVTAAIGTGPTATAYTVSGFPTAPLIGEVYPLTVALNDPASALGVVSFVPATGINWGGPVSIAQGACSGTTTGTVTAAGSYTPAVSHTGLGFSGDPTISAFTATSPPSAGGGLTPSQAQAACAAALAAYGASTYAGGAVASVTAPVTVGTVNDKSGYALASSGLNAIQLQSGITATQALQNLDAAVSTRSTYAGGPVASVTAPVTVGTVNDKSGYALASSGLDVVQVSTGINARQALQYLDAAVSTRSTYAGGPVASVTAPVTVGTVNDKSGYALASSGLDAIPIEAGVNARQALSPILAACAGIVSGAGTGVVVIQGGNSAITRITAMTDNIGNRSSVTLTLPT